MIPTSSISSKHIATLASNNPYLDELAPINSGHSTTQFSKQQKRKIPELYQQNTLSQPSSKPHAAYDSLHLSSLASQSVLPALQKSISPTSLPNQNQPRTQHR